MSGFASISGSDGNDLLAASGEVAHLIDGGAGNDTIVGQKGNDTLIGGDGHDFILGSTGTDLLMGDAGNDTLDGGTGDDTLIGGIGNDKLIGSDGNDHLIGGAGTDTLVGNSGTDTFEFHDGFGHDLITDFQIGSDLLQIASGINATGVTDPSDLLSMISANGNGHAVITLGGDSITLYGISVSDLANHIDDIVQII